MVVSGVSNRWTGSMRAVYLGNTGALRVAEGAYDTHPLLGLARHRVHGSSVAPFHRVMSSREASNINDHRFPMLRTQNLALAVAIFYVFFVSGFNELYYFTNAVQHR